MKRDAMVFPFRWVDSLLELEDDLPVMLVAIREYAENGTEPTFKGAMAALWREYKDRIDRDAEHYKNICERNKANGANGGRPKEENPAEPKKPNGLSKNPKKPKKADGEGDIEGDEILKESVLTDAKEEGGASASGFSFASSCMKKADFTKWGEAEFLASVAEAVKGHPEYVALAPSFTRYWLEPDKTGRPRFAIQKTWSTAGRMATWFQRAEADRRARGGGAEKPGGFYRDPKTGIVTGTGDEESYAEWKRNGGF